MFVTISCFIPGHVSKNPDFISYTQVSGTGFYMV